MFEDLEIVETDFSREKLEEIKVKYMKLVKRSIARLQKLPDNSYLDILKSTYEVIDKVCRIPTHGYDIKLSISRLVKRIDGFEVLVRRLMQDDRRSEEVKLWSAMVLSQCLTTENCNYLIDKELFDTALDVAFTLALKDDVISANVGSGLVMDFTFGSEEMCSDVIEFGGIDVVMKVLENSKDHNTIRNCAVTLANFAMNGTEGNLKELLRKNVIRKLKDLIELNSAASKYYGLLAVAVLAVNNEEAKREIEVLGILDSVEDFLNANPSILIRQEHFESKFWLGKFVRLLNSGIKQAQMLSAFYLMREAKYQSKRHTTEIFWEINAVEPLMTMKKSSVYASNALQLMSENVSDWEIQDVIMWLTRVGFAQFECDFTKSRIDGDVLLTLTEENLKDVGMKSILSKSFFKKLKWLKKKNDLYNKLSCEVVNSSSRKFDVFISYRRSNGSEFASYLKKCLEELGFSVFLDVDNLQSGEFDTQLIDRIKNSAVFVLLLTPNALDRCTTDKEDWLTKEIITAVNSKRGIVPIAHPMFEYPTETDDKKLPKKVCKIKNYQRVDWHHDAKDDCIKKLEKYINQQLIHQK